MSKTVKRGGCGQCPYDETTCYEMKKTGGICAYDGLFVEITFDECKYRKFPTNGDRIRNMTDERLAEFLSKVAFGCEYCDMKKECMYGSHAGDVEDNCEAAWLDWMKRVVDE